MKGYRNGVPRILCDICPTKNRYVKRVVFRGQEMNLCGPCRVAAEKILAEEAEANAPFAVPSEEDETTKEEVTHAA